MIFYIHGNQEDKTGNPIGYTRTTQGSKWTVKAKRYEAWKDYVWKCCQKQPHILRFKPGEKVVISCYIEYKNERRADPGNVVKGIVDALADKKLMLHGKLIGTEERLYPNDRCVLERCMDYCITGTPGVSVVVLKHGG